jgi:hypothetical protein
MPTSDRAPAPAPSQTRLTARLPYLAKCQPAKLEARGRIVTMVAAWMARTHTSNVALAQVLGVAESAVRAMLSGQRPFPLEMTELLDPRHARDLSDDINDLIRNRRHHA